VLYICLVVLLCVCATMQDTTGIMSNLRKTGFAYCMICIAYPTVKEDPVESKQSEVDFKCNMIITRTSPPARRSASQCSHFRTHRSSELLPTSFSRKNFTMISQTVQELTCWQRNKVSTKRTLLKTIHLATLSLRGWSLSSPWTRSAKVAVWRGQYADVVTVVVANY